MRMPEWRTADGVSLSDRGGGQVSTDERFRMAFLKTMEQYKCICVSYGGMMNVLGSFFIVECYSVNFFLWEVF